MSDDKARFSMVELMARGASGPPLPGWLWIVLVVAFVGLAAYGISRKRRG
ncbi:MULTISPECIES: hypothetical protein [Streptomyces]|uniref:DUF4381 domain-containing protein n=1 Tax=Streptomyces doebereineriae TaxID=3075528 RepID=A0ABU2VN20_9ACTN|nr:hypothetical protein [Streptomyces sp. DSM 41640]MDT0486496.1 hypothetical protein [Streptomyces sp. DSM 41640]